jgi:lipopolysaccharide biosynthesis regulator YciM
MPTSNTKNSLGVISLSPEFAAVDAARALVHLEAAYSDVDSATKLLKHHDLASPDLMVLEETLFRLLGEVRETSTRLSHQLRLMVDERLERENPIGCAECHRGEHGTRTAAGRCACCGARLEA